jgi:hypothetical protein
VLSKEPAENERKPSTVRVAARLQRPTGWSTSTPVAELRAGSLLIRPAWEVAEKALVQNTRRQQEFLVSRQEFGDFELSIRVKPLTPGKAGIAIRIEDADAPASSGINRMIAVARSTRSLTTVHETRGMVRSDEEGPALLPLTWNHLQVRCVSSKVEFTINGEKCPSINLPAGTRAKGAVALMASGARIAFDDLRVTEIPSGRLLFNDDFNSGTQPSDENWRTSGGAAGRRGTGFVRLTNTGRLAFRCRAEIRFHEKPWGLRPLTMVDDSLEPGRASPWLWLEDLPNVTAPCTLRVTAIPNVSSLPKPETVPRSPSLQRGPKESAKETPAPQPFGALEFSRSLEPTSKEIIRKVPLSDELTVVEIQQLDIPSATDLRTPAEVGSKLLRQVQALKFVGRRPEKFPTGSPAVLAEDLEAGRLLGFNAVAGTPQKFPADLFRKFGYRFLFANTTALESRDFDYGYKIDALNREFQRVASLWSRLGLAEKIYLVNLTEGSQLDIDGQLRKVNPANLAVDPEAWKQMMRVAGLQPSDFADHDDLPPAGLAPSSPEYWEKLRTTHPTEWKADPAGALKTLKLLGSIWPTRFNNGRESVRQVFRRGAYTSARIDAEQYLRLGLGGLDPWNLYTRQQSPDIPQACDGVGDSPLDEEFLIDLQRSSLNGANRPVFSCLAGPLLPSVRQLDSSGGNLERRAMCALGAGARGLNFLDWGPRWQADERWYSDDLARLQMVGKVNHAVGWIEDILMEGRPQQGEIGIIVSPISDSWNFTLRSQEALDAVAERRLLHHLFRSMHYQVDFLHEELLPRDFELQRYRVLVLAQSCITPVTTQKLQEWVSRGGTLIGIGALGQYSESRQPQPGMLPAFGIKELSWLNQEFRTVSTPSGMTLRLDQPVRKIVPGEAKVLVKYGSGEPAVLRKSQGKGQFLFCGFAPGLAYEFGLPSQESVPGQTQAAVRDLVRPWLASTGTPLCRTDHPQAGARIIRSYLGNALFLVNHSAAPLPRVRVTIQISGLKAAESLTRGALKFTGGKTCEFDLPLETTDVVRLK